MSARTAEIARIRAPVKKEIKHLDGGSQKKFPELLNKVVKRLHKHGYKLSHVTKSYWDGESMCSDSFWKRTERVENIKIVWLCTLTLSFDGGVEFRLDFDFWFEFSKFMENLRGELYGIGFPYTDRDYAERFGKREATVALEEVEEEVKSKLNRQVGGWGRHGIIDDVTGRESLEICHRKEISITEHPELEKLRESLREITAEPVDLVENLSKEIRATAEEKLEELIPFEIQPESLEGYIALFLWFRKPGGGFEFQLYRFVQENYGRGIGKKEISDALLKLEVHRYVEVKEVPDSARGKLENLGIKRCRRFYQVGPEGVPGRKLFDNLKGGVDLGAFLAPLSKKHLIDGVDAPNHLVEKSIEKLCRKNFLHMKKVRDYLGRTVRKIKPKRSPKGLEGLERKIMDEAESFYDVQKGALDQIQEGRP